MRTLLWPLRGPRATVADEAWAAVRPLRRGFVTDALRPKAPTTFLSLLPRFLPTGLGVPLLLSL